MVRKSRRRLPLFTLALVPLLAVIVYSGSVQGPFVYDDRIHILENTQVTSFGSSVDIVSAIYRLFEHPFGLSGRPLLFLTYGFNYLLAGPNPAAFRLVNIFIHAVNSLLVALVAFELGHSAGWDENRRFYFGLLAGSLFATHTLLTESVTYIAGRSSSLCAILYFAGLYFVLRAGHASGLKRRALELLCAACAIVGWLVKQDAITLPAASIVLVWLCWPRSVATRDRWIATAVLACVIPLTLLTQMGSLTSVSSVTQGNDILVSAGFDETPALASYFLTSVKEYTAYYLPRFVLPVRLSVDPGIVIVNSPWSIGVILSALVLLFLGFCVFLYRRSEPVAAVGIALVLVSPLSAYCLFPLADVVAEHRAYISVLGATILIASLLLRMPRALLVSSVVVIVFAWMTIERNKVWTDEALLWEDAVRKAPDNLRPHLNLGYVYQTRGEFDRAIQEYSILLNQQPEHQAALSNLAVLYLARNEVAKAEDLLNRAVIRQSKLPLVYMNLAVVRMRRGELAAARSLLQHAQNLNPSELLLHHNLGDLWLAENSFQKAIDEYAAELRLNPDSTITHLHLGRAYEMIGNRSKSVEEYRIVMQLDPANEEARMALQRLR